MSCNMHVNFKGICPRVSTPQIAEVKRLVTLCTIPVLHF